MDTLLHRAIILRRRRIAAKSSRNARIVAMERNENELTLGERLSATRSAQGHRARLASSLARFSHKEGPTTVSKRNSKKGPREISSRRAVPLGRDRCLGIGASFKKAVDPRFEEHCGKLHDEHIERNFAFVDGLREKEVAELQNAVRKKPFDEDARAQLHSAEAQQARRKAELRKKSIVAEVRRKEKAAVKEGKTPYFMKKSELRELELEAKFNELKQKGGIKKYIEKRRKRAASKARKHLPSRRDGSASGV